MRNWVLALVHALWLVLLQLFYLNLNWVAPVEEDIVEMLTKVETYFFPAPKPNDKIIFVNTAYSTSVASVNDNGTAGTISITDRQKLADLFSYLAAHHNEHKYVLCDVKFSYKSDADSSLQQSINKLKNYILPQHINPQNDSLQEDTIIKGRKALADYVTYRVAFSKMMLRDSKYGNSLPFQMFLDMSDSTNNWKNFRYSVFGLWNGLHSRPNTIFPRFYYTKENLEQHEVSLNALDNLIKIMSATGNDSSFYNSMFNKSIIVIGNFNDDVQPTAIGFIPGTLILLNSYFTLYHYDLFSIWYLLFLFVCFTLISYYVFHHENLKKRFTTPNHNFLLRFFFKKDRLFWILLIISIISQHLFAIHSTIFLLTVYFLFIEYGKKIFHYIKRYLI